MISHVRVRLSAELLDVQLTSGFPRLMKTQANKLFKLMGMGQ